MKMDKVAGSGNDEFYTPKYAIVPILEYVNGGGNRMVSFRYGTESICIYVKRAWLQCGSYAFK